MTMEASETTLSELGLMLQKSQAPEQVVRTEAEKYIVRVQQLPGFLTVALKFVDLASAPEHMRVAAAILLKNCVKARWIDDDHAENPLHLICDADRAFLHSHLVRVMLEAPNTVRRQLSQALALVANHDFPAKWTNLLPELIAHLSSPDYQKVTGVLASVHSIFKPYRFASKTEQLWQEIKFVLTNFSGPLLEAFQRVCKDVEVAQAAFSPDLDALLNITRLIAHIFLSLSSQDIPEQFEDTLTQWMPRFLGLLKLPRPDVSEGVGADAIASADPHDPPQILDRVQAVVCQCATLYADKYEEEFRTFVPDFVGCVWSLLTSLSELSRHDPVIIFALKFLTSVVSKPWHKDLFSSDERLRGICERIVIPNIRLRASDLELFTCNGLEYVRRDMEGSDQSTRRRLTCDLVRALTVHFEQQVSQILFGYVEVLIKDYLANRLENWISKDAAMFVIVALAVQGQTTQRGATKVNQHINVLEFFSTHVLPELQQADISSTPVLKADAIKFVSTFRSLLPPEACEAMLPILVRFLASEEFVVHTYAASALERILTLRDANTRQAVVPKERLHPHLGTLLTALFNTLSQPESTENDYVMKAIMRVCAVARSDATAFVQVLLERLTRILTEVQKNPRNPMFNHYLFETLAVLVRNVCAQNRAQVDAFEQVLFGPFEVMLSMESCTEFGPYVFQILGQLLQMHDQVPPIYEQMFPLLLTPAMWQQSGSVQALAQLIQIYLSKPLFAAAVSGSDRLQDVLGVFQKLVSSKINDKHGILILRSLLHRAPWQSLAPLFPQVLTLLLHRTMNSSTPQFARSFVTLLCDFCCCRSFEVLHQTLESIQPGLVANVVKQVLLVHAPNVINPIDRKVVELGIVHLVAKSPLMMVGTLGEVWPTALRTLVDMLAEDASGRKMVVKSTDDASEEMLHKLQESGGYSNAYARLAFALNEQSDEYPSIEPRSFFATALGELCQSIPGQMPARIQQLLTASELQTLQSLLQQHNVTLV